MGARNRVFLYNRETGLIEQEQIYEKWFMDWFYGTGPGRLITRFLLSKKGFSRGYAWFKKRPGSKGQIIPFVEKYNIDISELEEPLERFRDFNHFFTRRLKPGARPIEMSHDILISPADGRMMTLYIDTELIVPIKGLSFTLGDLLGGVHKVDEWMGGTCVKVRLAPFDYHRFCYIDNGYHGPVVHVDGHLHSISPLALQHRLKILHGNLRDIVVLETENFGKVAHIDIGAITVGRIHQHYCQGTNFRKGQEKGYFEFGGSTIVLLFGPGRIRIDEDILHYSRKGIESLVRYGGPVGRRIK